MRAITDAENLSRADRFAFEVVRAIAEAFLIHRAHHLESPGGALGLALREHREVGNLRAHEEHGAGIGAGGDAGATTDAGSGFHGGVGDRLGDGQGVAIGSGASAGRDEPAGLLDALEGGAINDEVPDDAERFGPERLTWDGASNPDLEIKQDGITTCQRHRFLAHQRAYGDQAALKRQ